MCLSCKENLFECWCIFCTIQIFFCEFCDGSVFNGRFKCFIYCISDGSRNEYPGIINLKDMGRGLFRRGALII